MALSIPPRPVPGPPPNMGSFERLIALSVAALVTVVAVLLISGAM